MALNRQQQELYRGFGINGDHLPDGALGELVLGFVRYYIISKAEAKERGLFHRVFAVCPACGKNVAASRLPQHLPVHDRSQPC